MVPALNRLPERKQMLIGPVAAQRFQDPLGLGLAGTWRILSSKPARYLKNL